MVKFETLSSVAWDSLEITPVRFGVEHSSWAHSKGNFVRSNKGYQQFFRNSDPLEVIVGKLQRASQLLLFV